jgi:hypothetical protein
MLDDCYFVPETGEFTAVVVGSGEGQEERSPEAIRLVRILGGPESVEKKDL